MQLREDVVEDCWMNVSVCESPKHRHNVITASVLIDGLGLCYPLNDSNTVVERDPCSEKKVLSVCREAHVFLEVCRHRNKEVLIRELCI